MKKKTKITLVIILFVAIFLGTFYGIYQFGLEEQTIYPGECGNSEILSLSNVKVTTSTNLAGKEVIKYETSARQTAQCARIFWTDSEVKTKLIEGGYSEYDISQGLFADFKKVEQFRTYTAESTGKHFQKISKSIVNNYCGSNPNEYVSGTVLRADDVGGIFGAKCRIYYLEPIGEEGTFDEGSQQDFIIEYNIEGIGTGQINSEEQLTSRIGDKAFISWSRNALGLNWLDNPNYDVVFMYGESDFRIIEDGSYPEFKTVELEIRSDPIYLETTYASEFELDSKMNNYNSQIDLIIDDKTAEYSNNNLINGVIKTGASMKVDIAADVTYPIFSIEIEGAEVGLHKVEGNPFFSKCIDDGFEINSGDFYNEYIIIKNDVPSSQEFATFSIGSSCDTSSDAVLSKHQISLLGQEQERVNVRITMGVSTEGQEGSCVITATDLTNPDNTVSCDFTFTGSIDTGCTQDYCLNGDFYNCNLDGGTSRIECEHGCYYDKSGQARCQDQIEEICDNGIDDDLDGNIDSNDTDCANGVCGSWLSIGSVEIIPNIFCLIGNWFSRTILPFIQIIGGVMTVLVIIGSYISIESFIKKNIGTLEKQHIWMTIIASVLIGAIFVMLFVWKWYYGLLILFILFLVRGIVPILLKIFLP